MGLVASLLGARVQSVDVVVLGAGAAGLMAAIEAGRRNRRTLVLDHAERIGKKILISGGGRCNFTNINARAENLLSANPHFAKSAMAGFTPADFIALVEKHGIAYHEKTLGQLFCDRSAHDIVNMLQRECDDAGVRILTGTNILTIRQTSDGVPHRYTIETSAGSFRAASVIVATGGLSIPRMGATDFGYKLAEQFGLNVLPCRPALVPLVFIEDDRKHWCDLSGLSAEAVAQAEVTPQTTRFTGSRRPTPFREKMLITHRGLSGPVILQASSYWQPGTAISLDLAPGARLTAPLFEKNARRDAASAIAALRTVLPARFAERWLAVNPPTGWSNTALESFERNLHEWKIRPAGTEGYAKAEVTAGGIDTNELNAATMESRRAPGLYFIGEVVDVTGWLGGYNFQWAWASGAAAGRSA